MREMVGGCCVCSDDRGWSENPLVYCDGQSCTVAVHQACYGIVTVPTGPWYCRKCESQERSVKVKCELCPSKYGALKRTDNSGWAHVVCALYIPEVRFGNVTTMEPIQLQLIPTERFNKVCYICEEKGKASSATVGACMQCNKAGCKQQFHVTCAQSLGLLCEEAGNYLDNVKYCGYCQHHYSKLKKGGNVKTIPPYKPVSSENHLSDSNSEKEVEAASGSSKTTSSSGQQISNTSSSSTSSNKRKASSSSKTSSSSSSKTSSSTKSSSSSSSSHQKTVHSSSSSSTTTPSVINNSSNTGATSGSNNTTGSKSGGSGSTDSKSKLSSSSSNIRSAKNLQEDSASSTNLTNSVVETVDKLETNQSTDTIPSTTTSSGGTNNNNNNNINTSSGGNSTTTNKDIVKNSKKRKTHSRTPTPVGLSAVEGGGVSVVQSVSDTIGTTAGNDKKSSGDTLDKPKKIKVETTQSILTNQPVVALTSISTIKSLSLSSTTPTLTDSGDSSTIPIHSNSSNSTIIQSSSSHPPVNSLVVSVPLTSTSLSPHSQILNNQTSVVQPTPGLHLESVIQERSSASANGNQSKMIVYDKQDTVTEVDMELEISPQDIKRSSQEKSEKTTRGSKKRISGANGVINQLNQSSNHSQSSQPPTTVTTLPKRSSRSSSAAAAASSTTTTPSPSPQIQGAFSSISQSQIKDSPPSSPSSESQQSTASGRAGSSCSKTKTRKSAPASISTPALSPKETKDIKLFQNGCTAPHMLGNQLNPNSNMAQKMSDHLNSELEAHSIFNPNEPQPNMVGPQLHHRVIASARASSAGGSSTASGGSTSGGSGISSMLGGSGGNIPQTLDQLLERQWEQGSQFLMEQAQHFDIASLLSCLHQLRAENLRLEEHVSSLLQRRDHLLAVNARLAIPLTGQPATPQSSHPHTVNNIHPAVGASHGDIPRSSRHSYPAHPQGSQHPSGQIIENGLQSNEPQYSHRSPAPPQSQPSPSIRHSPAGPGYPSSNIYRQSTSDVGGRSASAGSSSGSRATPQGYPLYQGPGGPSSSQPQIIRRDSDIHYQSSSKPS